jgi:hypothetical protein
MICCGGGEEGNGKPGRRKDREVERALFVES